MKAFFCRKLANIEELKEITQSIIDKGQQGQPYTVVREVRLNNADFAAFANDFFENQPWITKDDGGANMQGEIRVIRVINKDNEDTVLVNNEGYSYARYTALELD